MNELYNNKHFILNPILFAFWILIFVTIINSNKYHASIAFILYPVIIVFLFCLIFLRFELKRIIGYIPILLICILTVYSTVKSDVVEWGTTSTSFILFAILYVLLTIRKFGSHDIKLIFKFYAYMTLLLSIWLLINVILSNNLVDGRVSLTILGIRKDENYLSSYLSFGFYYFISAFFWGKKKKSFLLLAGIIFIAVFMTGSRGGLISILIAFAIILIKYLFADGINTRHLMYFLIIIFFGLFIYFALSESTLFFRMSDTEGYTENIRLTIWEYAMEGFWNKPWIGSGIQSGTYYAQLHVRWYTHSCFIDMLTSIGLLGTSIFGFQYIKFCRVKKGNIFFLIGLLVILFMPLMFINGYETATFWVPMALCKITSDYCKYGNFNEILK